MPAPGQGAIALECGSGDAAVRDAVAPLGHEPTARAVAAERAFLAALGGGCNVPRGPTRSPWAPTWSVAFVAAPDGRGLLRGERRGADAEALGRTLAEDLRARGTDALIGRG